MNILNILPLELSQQIYKYYFENVLRQIETKYCFKTFYIDPMCIKSIKCAVMPTPYSAFCYHCINGHVEYY